MKKPVLLMLCVLAAVQAGAAANITDVAVSPDDTVWTTDAFELIASCTGGDRVTVTNITQDISSGENIFSVAAEELVFALQDGQYVLDGATVRDYLPDDPGFEPGAYTFAVACDGDNTDTETVNMTVRTLDIALHDGLNTGPFYTGAGHRLAMQVRVLNGGSPVLLGGGAEVNITAHVDGNMLDASAFYNSNDGWVMQIPLPGETGTHTATITAAYDGVQTSLSRQIVVEDPLQYTITPSTTSVASGDTITVDVAAAYQGDALSLSDDTLAVGLGDGDDIVAVPFNVSTSGPGSATLSVTLPDRSSGSYPLQVQLATDEVAATRSVDISYPMQISGAFRDVSGAGIPFQLFFRGDGTLVKQFTGSGQYETTLTPGTYDVELRFPDGTFPAKATLSDVDVEDWDHPVQFQRYTDTAIPGFALGGLYAFQTSLDPDEITLALAYSTRAVTNPRSLRVYHCGGWNVERATCYTAWEQVPATFDRVARTVSIEDAAPGAYAVAARGSLNIQYTVDASTYTPDQEIGVSGVVQDEQGNAVQDANVTVSIPAASTRVTATTDGEGIFDVSMPAPDRARNYTATIRAEKEPYTPADQYFYATVERPARLNVVAPDQLRIAPNETRELTVYLQNTGYRVLDDVAPRMDNVSFLRATRFNAAPIEVNETREATLVLHAPLDAEPGTRKEDLSFAYAGKTAATSLGITVTAPASSGGTTISGMVAGMGSAISARQLAGMTPSGGPLQLLVLLVIGAQVVVVGAILFRRRRDRDPRGDVTAAFDAVKGQIGGRQDGGADRPAGRQQPPQPRAEGETRERVMHAVSQIKNEIQKE